MEYPIKLAAGSHEPEEGQACVMEVVSLLTGDEWTDYPSCTNPVLARAAQCVNDKLDDGGRQQLLSRIGRLAALAG